MQYINSFKIFESGEWWLSLIPNHPFKIEEIKDALIDLKDVGMDFTVDTEFMTDNFEKLFKKTDLLSKTYYCAYSIRIGEVAPHSSINEFIERNNIINDIVYRLNSEYKISIVTRSSIKILCIDTESPLDLKLVKYPKFLPSNTKDVHYYNDRLKIHSKILLSKIDGDSITIQPINGYSNDKLINNIEGMFSDDFIKRKKYGHFTDLFVSLENGEVLRLRIND